MNKATALVGAAVLAFTSVGCASSPAPPFDTLPQGNLTAFRLQNYEPPAPPPGAAAPQGPGMIPGVPPQIQQWVQQGAQGLQQLIPPGLIPPGMLGGMQPGAPAPQPQQDTTPRFHNFRILSQTQVIDPDLKEELADILGDEDNFTTQHANCLYAEMGLSWTTGAGASNDLLVSFSCNQVAARTFAWPHQSTGMKADTVKELSDVVQKLWPPGT